MYKYFFLTLLLFGSINFLSAQLGLTYATRLADGDKKLNFYQQRVKEQVEQQNYCRAAVTIIRAMEVAEKKKQIRKIGKQLAEVYPIAIAESQQNIRWLNTQLRNADADFQEALQYELWQVYRDLNHLIQLYQALPAKRQKSKIDIKLFHSELEDATDFSTAD